MTLSYEQPHVLRYSEDMNIDDCWEETVGLNAGV